MATKKATKSKGAQALAKKRATTVEICPIDVDGGVQFNLRIPGQYADKDEAEAAAKKAIPGAKIVHVAP